jgi:hypothetical protein
VGNPGTTIPKIPKNNDTDPKKMKKSLRMNFI